MRNQPLNLIPSQLAGFLSLHRKLREDLLIHLALILSAVTHSDRVIRLLLTQIHLLGNISYICILSLGHGNLIISLVRSATGFSSDPFGSSDPFAKPAAQSSTSKPSSNNVNLLDF
jgi:hypothetical protein